MDQITTEKIYPIQSSWILKSIVGTLLALIILIPLYILIVFMKEINNKFAGIYIPLAILFGLVQFIMVVLRVLAFHYSLEEKFIKIKQGVFSRQERNIPYGVIQNIYINRDLFDRAFNLATVVFENASMGGGVLISASSSSDDKKHIDKIGSHGNSVSIPGLRISNAEALKEQILQKIRENPIEDNQSGL